MIPKASADPPKPTIAPANAGPTTSDRPWIEVSRAFTRDRAVTGTRRGSSVRIPDMVSGLVSENTPTSASSTGAFAQPRQSTAINAITHVALGSLSADYFTKKFGVDPRVRFAVQLKTLQDWGYATIDGDTIRLNRDGLLQVDRLLHEFFLPEHRHARYA